MRKIILLVALCLFVAFAFATDANLVAYYNNTTESHACTSGNMLCAYNQLIKIPSDFSGTCGVSAAVKILGLSDPTDAHVDAGTLTPANFAGNNVCMSANTFTSGACYFTWSASCDASTGYNCMFGLSDIGNAHLSACNTFNPEYKFCCKFQTTQPSCPQMNLLANKTDLNFGQTITFTYSCPAGNIDANVWIDINNFFRTNLNQCGPAQKSFDLNSAQLDMGTYNPKTFVAQMFTSDGACKSPQVTFNVTIPSAGGIITPVERCKIKSISADALKLDSNTLADVNIGINYDCYNDGVNETLIVFDPSGNVLGTNLNIPCNTTTQKYGKFTLPSSSPEGIYRARIADANCMKDAFFAVTKSRGSSGNSNIPDTSMVPIIALLAFVTLILSVKKKRK